MCQIKGLHIARSNRIPNEFSTALTGDPGATKRGPTGGGLSYSPPLRATREDEMWWKTGASVEVVLALVPTSPCLSLAREPLGAPLIAR
jgi:hypothetical protein